MKFAEFLRKSILKNICELLLLHYFSFLWHVLPMLFALSLLTISRFKQNCAIANCINYFAHLQCPCYALSPRPDLAGWNSSLTQFLELFLLISNLILRNSFSQAPYEASEKGIVNPRILNLQKTE